MNVLVIGASRGSGLATAKALAAAGHSVTAYARTASLADFAGHAIRAIDGDAMDLDQVEKAVIGQDAVVVALGISDNPIRVRLTRRAGTPLEIRSAGTAVAIEAMRRHGVRRLVVQTTYGLGESWSHLPPSLKVFFTLVIRPQVRDHERQEELVRASDLDWTLVRPVVLSDAETDEPAHVDLADGTVGMGVSRGQVGRVVAESLGRRDWYGQTLSVSGQ